MRKQLLKGLCGLCALLLVAGCSSKFKPQWQTCELDGLSVEMPFALETYPDSRNELPEPVRKLVVDMQMLFHEEPELPIMGMINSTQYIPAVSGQLSLDGAAENGIAGIKARADQTGTDDIRMEIIRFRLPFFRRICIGSMKSQCGMSGLKILVF